MVGLREPASVSRTGVGHLAALRCNRYRLVGTGVGPVCIGFRPTSATCVSENFN